MDVGAGEEEEGEGCDATFSSASSDALDDVAVADDDASRFLFFCPLPPPPCAPVPKGEGDE